MNKGISRRGFLSGMLAAACAPAIVKAGNLMKISSAGILIPEKAGELIVMDDQQYLKKLAADFDGDTMVSRCSTNTVVRIDPAIWYSFPYNPTRDTRIIS